MRTRKDSDTSSHNRRKSFNPYWTSTSSTSKTLPSSIGGGGRKLRRRHLLLPIFRLILRLTMAGQSRKWMILVATIWIQAFTGTNFDFSAYSSDLKSVLGITQVQLNYLATASDLGKALGWSSGLALLYLPLPVVMFIAAFMGFAGYGVQWLVIRGAITLPYFVVFLLCLLAGCSICWFNTVCFVLCIRNFPESRALAISLTVSFNGVSAALYALAVDSIDSRTMSLYLILNAVIPLLTSFVALVPILRQPSIDPLPPEAIQYDSIIFLFLNILAVITGFYLLFLGSTNDLLTTRLFFAGAIFLLVFPLFVPGIVYARDWFKRTIHSNIRLDGSGFILVDDADLELHKELINREGSSYASNAVSIIVKGSANNTDETTNGEMNPAGKGASFYRTGMMFGKDRLVMLGEEHSAAMLVRRFDFWLYYVAYFCGGTIGLVYSNNLGQIAQSLGRSSDTTTLITLYSSFSFFGRLLSAAPDYVRARIYFPRTGWVAVALTPTPVAFFLLAASGSSLALHTGTALIGLSSGFIFAAAVSITSELFGPNSVGVNHNMLITNIPLGSLVYGLLAAVVYDANADYSGGIAMITDPVICMGRQCYFWTFVLWGSLSLVGLVSCALLFLRTRPAYYQFERDRISSQLDQRVL